MAHHVVRVMGCASLIVGMILIIGAVWFREWLTSYNFEPGSPINNLLGNPTGAAIAASVFIGVVALGVVLLLWSVLAWWVSIAERRRKNREDEPSD
jgi:hypothetical protein